MMATQTSSRKELSRNILQMKFMRKTAAASVERQLLLAEQAAEEAVCRSERWEASLDSLLGIPTDPEPLMLREEPNLYSLLSLGPARQSFGGFNPAIEQLNREEEAEDVHGMEATVDESEMAMMAHANRHRAKVMQDAEMSMVLKSLRQDVDGENEASNSVAVKRKKDIEEGEIEKKPKKKKRKKQ